LTVFIFTGCGAKGQVFREFEKPKENKGIAYIYRPSGFVGSAVYYDIHVTNETTPDQIAGRLSNGGYVKVDLPIGENEIWGETESKSSVTLDIKDGDISCIKGSVGIGFFLGRPHLSIVDMDTCKTEIIGTKSSYVTINEKGSIIEDSIIKCARMKGGQIIQEYDGVMNNNKILINGKDYSRKYIIMDESLEKLSQKGIKGHFCNIVKSSNKVPF